MKHTFMVLAAIFLLTSTSRSQTQRVGIQTTAPAATLSVGSGSPFRVDSTGNIVRIRNLQYSFPAALPATQQYLKTDAAGNLTWAPIAKVVIRVFTVVPFGSTDWEIDNPGDYVSNNNNDPPLVLTRGFTYQFAVTGGHPFWISNLPQSGSFGTGVTGNGTTNGTVTFTVPMDAPATLYYYCGTHAPNMNGTITIL